MNPPPVPGSPRHGRRGRPLPSLLLLSILLTSAPVRVSLAAEADPRMVAPPDAVRGRLPAIAPTPARDASKTFRVLDGFRMDLLAAEPLVASPVNLVNAPDGTLHVVDMYRENIEHPWSIPDDIHAAVDLESGRERGRIWRLASGDFTPPRPPRLGHATTAELVSTLENPNSWWRETAQRLLVGRQDPSAVPALRKMVRDGGTPTARLHALWSMEGLNGLTDEDALAGLADPAAGVRENAVRLAEPLVVPATERVTPPSTSLLRNALLELATKLFGVPASASRQEVVARYRPALSMKGDAARGRKVFETTCATCHRAGDQGKDVGPNLATIRQWNPVQVLINILDPNREVAPNFVGCTVETKAGRTLDGLIAGESAASLTLKRAEGVIETVLRRDIAQLAGSGLSLMPEGTEGAVTIGQMADLIAFLIPPR